MKSFIIFNPNDPISQKLVLESIESCCSFGLEVEMFPGTFDDDIDTKLNKYNLKISPLVPKITNGTKGCFISHYELWNKSVNENMPILILEHDVQMQNHLPTEILNLFDDVLNLDPCGDQQKDLEIYKNCTSAKLKSILIEQKKKNTTANLSWKSLKNNNISGAYSYIIKPAGAKKLIDAAKVYGFFPADVHINSYFLTLNTIKPSVFRICDFMIDRKNRIKFSSTKGYKHGIT
jgi:GR25 family glycosyltransferase involved in LPS biosynthesis